MNKLTIIGNLTREPEVRTINTVNGEVHVCTISVAVNGKKRDDESTFFNCTAWRGVADIISKYLHNGSKVAVQGPVSVRTYQAKDGTTKASLEVQVDDIEFLSKIERGDADDSGLSYNPPAAPVKKPEQVGFTAVETEDLPF